MLPVRSTRKGSAMKFVPAAIGAVLIIAALNMGKITVWGVECYYYGQPRTLDDCYSPGSFYTLVILGVVLLAVTGFLLFKGQMEEDRLRQKQSTSSQRHYSSVAASPSHSADVLPVAPSATSNPAWKTLKEFDADIRQAVDVLSGFGSQAEERLAVAYLAVNDKGLLPSIVAKIVADEEKDAIAREEEKARRAVAMSERERELLADRERKSEYTISRIKEVGMMHRGRKVVSAEMYYGATAADQGWAKIVYEDGKVELWAGSSWMEMNA